MERSSSMSAVEIAGTATAVAVALGGAMVARSRSQSRKKKQIQRYVPIEDIEKRAQPAADWGRELASVASERVSRQAPELAEEIAHAFERSRQAGRSRYRRQVPKEVQKVIEERRLSKKDKKALLEALRTSVVEPAAGIAERAQTSLRESSPDRKQTKKTAEQISETARERAGDIQSDLSKRLQTQVFPVLKRGSHTAGEQASKAIETVRKRASERDSLTGKDSVGDRAGAAREYVEESGHVARETASRVAQRSSNAAKDTTATLLWLAVASTIVYCALLSEERREQVKSAACSAFEQIRLLALDFRGYEPEM